MIANAGRLRLTVGMNDSVSPREPQLRELLAYWDRKRGANAMPSRGDIDPIEIPGLLPDLLIAETAERIGDFRYRLYGTRVCSGFGHDRTGMRFSELPQLVNHEEVYEGYWRAYRDRRPHYFHGRIVSLVRDFSRYSRLLLPLSPDGETVDRILGGVVFFPTLR